MMIKLLVITAIVMYLMRGLFKMMYPPLPPQRQVNQLLSCEYCGVLLPEDSGVIRKQHFFCTQDHAHRFFN